MTDRVPLEVRPEGIVLTKHDIWTSGAIVDRNTFTVTAQPVGFGITRAPDGSIWATGGIPGSSNAEGVAYRYSAGE